MSHIHLNLDVDFVHNILMGSAVLSISKIETSASEILLDIRGLHINSITDNATDRALEYTIHEEDYVGSKLEVQLPTSKTMS